MKKHVINELCTILTANINGLLSKRDIMRKSSGKRKIQRKVINALTELENAFDMYMTMASQLKLEVTAEAENFLMQYLYSRRLVDDFKSKLEVSDIYKSTPKKIAAELVETTKEILDEKNEVTEEVLKAAIKKLNTWPFQEAYLM
jgi:hypothetical protein